MSMADEFPHKYGVAVDDELNQKINRHLERGDSRSARIRRLIRLGLIFEDAMLERQYWPPSTDQREQILREAIQMYLDEELD